MPEQVGSLYARVGADASSFHSTMRGVRTGLSSTGRSFASVRSGGAGMFAALAAGGAAIGVLKGAISTAGEFQSTIAQLGVQTGQGAKGMTVMGAKAIKLGADIRLPGTSASDAAEAMLELAKGGQTMGQVMKSVRGVLVASAAGTMSNADAANTVVGALGAFHLAADKSASVANLLAGGANASTASMQDMAFSLQMGGAAANAAHVPIQTFVAMTAEMANAGIKGSDAGTSLKQMFLALSPTTKKAKEAIADYGVSAFDAHHKMLPMPVIIGKYHKALKGMSDEQRISTLKTIFGSDAYRAANVILGNGVPVLKKLTTEVSKEGQAAKLAAAKNSGMKGAIDGVKSSWNTFQVVLGQRVSPAVKIASRRLSTFLGDITKLIQPTKDLNAALGVMPKNVAGPAMPIAPAAIAKGAQMMPPTPAPSFTSGLEAAVRRAVAGVPWAQIGREASEGFLTGLGKIADNADKIINGLIDAFARNREKLADVGAQMIAAIFVKLADPSFWAKHWDLALGVALAVFPIGKIAKVGSLFLKPFAGLGAKLGVLMGDAVLFAAEKAGGKLGGAVLNVGAWVSRAGPKALSEALKLGGKVVTGVVNGVSKLGFLMRTTIYTSLVNVLGELAVSAYNFAENIGSQIASGVIAGVQSLAGSLKDTITDAVMSPLRGLQGALHIKSPSKWTADNLGKPIMQGVIQGINSEGANARGGQAKVMQSVLDAAKAVVDSKKSVLQSAFGRLGEDIGNAFEAGTAKGLRGVAAKFDALRAQDSVLKAAAGQTPAETALAGLQANKAATDRARSLSEAEAGMVTARAGGDPAAIASAQKALEDARYEQMVAGLEAQAALERAAADAAAVTQSAAYDQQQAREELDYQAKRDLQKRHLDAMLLDLQAQLEKHPGQWKAVQKKITDWFKKTGSPDMQEAGKNLGLAFATGIAESKTAISKAAEGLAKELKAYLQLKSPAEKGPLSSLDSWWTAMPKTLLSGVDGRELGDIASGIASPGLGASMAGGGSGNTYITVPLTVDGILVHEAELATKIRDLLLPIARRNGGSIFGGAA